MVLKAVRQDGEALQFASEWLKLPCLHPSRAIRNPLLELRVWIFDIVFGNFGALIRPIFVHRGASGP